MERGLEVDLAGIDKALARFWEGGDAIATRASLVNLAVYSDRPASLSQNSQLISDLTREHACRAILISSDPAATENRVRAWINAHCHITRAGAKQVCCEQISFHIEGSPRDVLANIVFAHLDSDLPLYFWWQGEFDTTLCSQMWGWVDRLIYDSREWREPGAQFAYLEREVIVPRLRVALCDLDWARIVYFRQGLAQIFDHPDAAVRVPDIDRVEIAHSAEGRSTALMLTGWLAAQLEWKSKVALTPELLSDCNGMHFTTGTDAKPVEIGLTECPGAPISRLHLNAPGMTVTITREADSAYMPALLGFSGDCEINQLLPAGRDSLVDVVSEELVRGGRHRVYLRALEKLGYVRGATP
jgi:glucose-6-phosphate dehydrogenase assembly protein OpcA